MPSANTKESVASIMNDVLDTRWRRKHMNFAAACPDRVPNTSLLLALFFFWNVSICSGFSIKIQPIQLAKLLRVLPLLDKLVSRFFGGYARTLESEFLSCSVGTGKSWMIL